MSAKKKTLFDDDDGDGDLNLTINKSYAESYSKWRPLELKQNLINKYGDQGEDGLDSSTSEDEDDSEALKKAIDKDFLEAITSLKTGDPRLYDKKVEFFKSEKTSNPEPGSEKKTEKKQKDKPVYLRDYERKLITERGGELSDDDSDNEHIHQRSLSPSYIEQQKLLKESFKKVLQDDDSEDEGDLLQKKTKTKEEVEKDEEDYIQWLKGEREALPDKETEEKLKPLQNIWNDPSLEEGDKFLRDYFLNKRYLESDNYDGNVSEDDDEDNRLAEFEHKFNFRFEEPDKEFLKRYPRTIENSLRKKDTRRKEKRDAVKQRKEEEKLKKKEELKLLKSLKRKEIIDKIEKIKQITGNDQLGLDPEELEADFDPEEHDRKMRELFNDDYYGGADDAEDEDELNLPPLEEELLDDDNMNWDEWDGTDKVKEFAKEENEANGEGYTDGPHCEDPDFIMDCDYDPNAESQRREVKAGGRQSAREKRKLKRQSRFGRLVRKEKPVFDPKDKTFQQYVDEYYGMDYEDLIGDIPCRFKYRSVVPNNFGLTIEEILAADDKELNQWASIKKTYTIRPEHVEKNEAKIYAQKALNEELKRKILPSLYRQENENMENDGEKTKKKKNKHGQDSNNEEKTGIRFHCDDLTDQTIAENGSSVSKKEEKKKRKADAVDTGESYSNGAADTSLNSGESKKAKKRKRKAVAVEVGECNGTTSVTLNENIEDVKESSETKKKKKKRKTDQNETSEDNNVKESNQASPENTSQPKGKKEKKQRAHEENNQGNKKSKKSFNDKNKYKKNFNKWKKNKNGEDNQETDLSDARLKAYGFNPKQYRNKLKYGPQH